MGNLRFYLKSFWFFIKNASIGAFFYNVMFTDSLLERYLLYVIAVASVAGPISRYIEKRDSA